MNSQMLFEALQGFVLLLWSFTGVRVLVGHIAVNVVMALAAAQVQGDFELGRVGEFLFRKMLPYVTVYAVLKAFGEAAGLQFLAPVVWGTIEVSLTGDLMDSLARLGLQLPEPVARLVVKR